MNDAATTIAEYNAEHKSFIILKDIATDGTINAWEKVCLFSIAYLLYNGGYVEPFEDVVTGLRTRNMLPF
jgi:hypothetical protein